MKFPLELLQRCWFIAGPTASGKSALGIQLAQQINGEIVSLDSMAIYRGMDIGTAKPSAEELDTVPHHLIDVVDPHEDFSTAEYLKRAITACEEITNRGCTPIFVGGTGLYLRAILRGVFEGPEADWDFRRQLEEEAQQHEPNWLHQQLQQVDPTTAERLHPNDTRRLVRALEIIHITGQPASELHQEAPLPIADRPVHVFWLNPDRVWLHERINSRVDQMIAAGFLQEVQQLLQNSPPIGRTARQALGYRELIDHIEDRISTLEEAVELIKTRTRQFAKRQYTWFRNLDECHPIEIGPQNTIANLLQELTEQ